VNSESWRDQARCLIPGGISHDPDFFPEVGDKADMRRRAKSKCFACNVRTECLDWALKAEGRASAQDRYGIFGAMEPTERYHEFRNREAEEANSARLG
jgi:hypothetical protein